MPPKKKEPRIYCSVMGCKVTSINSPGTHFYSFPSLPHRLIRRQNWIDAVRNHNPQQAKWKPNKYSRICSHHFVGKKKLENPKSPSYNPTIFPEVCDKIRKPAEVERGKKKDSPNEEERSLKRIKTRLGDEILLENNKLPLNSTTTKNRKIQVDFEEKIYYHKLNNFSCKLYITDTTCEAEVQTSLQRVPKSRRIKLWAIDKSTNTNFRSHDNSCQTEELKFDCTNMLERVFTFEHSLITSNNEMLNIAGTTLSVFRMLLKILNRQNLDPDNSKVPTGKSLLIFLMRMKTGLPFSAISCIVGVDRTTVSRTFYVTLMYLTSACKRFVCWPSREVIQSTMPEAFKQTFKHCRVIFDCVEMSIDEPSCDKLSVKFYSDYSDRFTIKVLVGYAPNGVISFVSRCYPGATCDSEIVKKCGILNLLDSGDTVIADKIFSEVKESVEDNEQRIDVVRLSFTKNPIYAGDEIEDIDKIRRVSIDLQKLLRRMRAYKILKKLQVHMYPDSDSIVFMCAVLVNCHIIRQL